MKKNTLKLIVSALLITMIGGSMVGCGSGEDKGHTGNNSTNGSITVSGSSALLPLMEQSIEKFNEINPGAEISAQAGGSGTGLTQVLEGTVDIGNSDIFAEEKLDEAQSKELVDHKVIAQGFGIVVNKSLGITNLNKEQLKGIFSGKITNWKEIGGPDKEIFLIHRKSGSGTRGTFENKILDGDKSLENDSIGAVQDSNGAVLTTMKQNDGAISYLALSYMNTAEAKELLQVTNIDGISSENENIKNGSYPFWSWGHMYTNGEAEGLSKEFINFITSEDNKESIENLGFISGSEIKEK
ncbi:MULTISPECIES: phosphate ABC transporter substrate-binding protein [Clostridium]|uniref:Phosphate-binding protein n=1 Tax=Clostridium botulinum (strain Eklund 17B / Type B) TaxID=935198 RepID=B2THQ3_CLOBB|nr:MULTISPECIES: phosphate ABC transporter substrate-binding protein [Clostridium]ACD24484.1 periplasmic phosphate-binding protein [Clostridium botulinum B str. Eklund 17B (NRP)]MBY6974981.1 phosphate ABC transporter substrate-binding protein [Clostridium botulinum]MBY6999961.1 phosphate ABC transporter substrate-binding protein [Clostridium botulinum]MCR1274734.1 phosphate ABC transporter substrate-binding protein [Clostridium botulinum]NFD68534.1 phosphate ABC transporter substrate-binding p